MLGVMTKQRRGSVEMLAEGFSIHFELPAGKDFIDTVNQQLPMPPRFLENTKGSTEFAALETSIFSWAEVVECTKYVKRVVLILQSDLASSNVRLRCRDEKESYCLAQL